MSRTVILHDPLSLSLLVSIVSLFTSVTSILGFIVTTIMAWRKEKRELQNAGLDSERNRLEIEKLRRELAAGNKPDENS